MPRIQWSGLPAVLRDHLFDRLRERKITAEDLYQLKAWRESEPEAPDGLQPGAEMKSAVGTSTRFERSARNRIAQPAVPYMNAEPNDSAG